MHRIQQFTERVREARRQRATRHASRDAQRMLEHDLAGYTSGSDLVELDAILARYDDTETAQIRTILQRTPVRA
jgi:50S ribosomal subunit-associated GTPase HflX